MPSIIHQALSEKVLGAAFTVHNALGPGLLESAERGRHLRPTPVESSKRVACRSPARTSSSPTKACT